MIDRVSKDRSESTAGSTRVEDCSAGVKAGVEPLGLGGVLAVKVGVD